MYTQRELYENKRNGGLGQLPIHKCTNFTFEKQSWREVERKSSMYIGDTS